MDLLNPLRNRELGLNTNASALCFEQKAEAALISSSLTVKVCKLPNTTKSAYLLVLSPDGKHIASSHGDHNVYVCDAISGRLVHCFSGHVRTPWALAWGCNDLLASGCLAGQVRVWSLSTGCSELLVVEDHTAIASLAFHPTANLLAVASGHKLLLWDWREKYPFAECSTPNIKERISGTTPTASCSSVDTPPLMPYRCRELLRSRRELITMRSDLSRRHAELLDRYSELLRRYQALRDEYMPLLRRTVGSDLDAAATAQPLSGADANDVNSGATTAVLSNDTTAATTYVASTQAYTAAEGRSIPRPAFGAADNAEITLRAGETARSARNVNFYVADTELVPSYRYMGADHDYFSAANRLQRQLQAHFPDVNENFTPAEIIERRQIRELQRQRDELAGLVMRRQHVNEPPSLANSILDNLQNSLAQQAELPRFARRRPQSIEIIERNSERRQAANFVFGGERETSSSRGTASTTARTSTGGRATMFSDVRSASEQRSSANVSPPTIYPVLGQQRPLTWAQMMLENPSSSDSADRRSIERREQSFRNPFYAAALNANAPAVITPTDAPPSFVPASIDASISDPQIAGTSRHVSRDLANSSQPPLSPICLENLQDATAYARDITEQSMSDFLRHHNESVNRLQRSYSELSASAQRLVRMFQTTYDDMCRLQNEIDQRLGTESQRPSGRLGPARQLLDSLLKMQQILEKNATVKTVPAGQLHTYLTNETAVLLEVYHSLFQHLEGLDFPDESVQQLRDGESQIRQLQERLRVTTMQDTAEMSRIQLGLVNEVQNFQTFVLDWKNMVIERIRDGTFRLPLTADDNVPSHSDSSRRSTLEAVTISASTRVRFNLAPSTDKQKQEHSASSTAISSSSSERQSPSQNAPTLLKRTSESQPSNEGNADNDRSASTSQQQASASSSGTAAHITFFRQPPAKRQRLDASRPDAETHLQHVPSSPEQEVQNDNEVSSVEITFEPFSADTPAAAETNDATVQTLRQRFLRLSRLREEMRLRDLARRGIRNSAGSSTTQEGGNNTRVIQTSGNRISEFNRSQLARRNFRSRRPQPRTEYEHPDLSSNRSPQSLVSPSSSDIFSWERPSLMLQEPFLTEGSILRLERHLNVPALSDDVNDRWRGFYRPAPPPPPPPVPPIPSDFADDFEDEDRESSVDLQRAVNRAIAGAFIGAGDIAVANNILDLTARIQCWPYTPSKLPVLSTHDHIVAQRCKLHNDSSVCVSPCGQFIAAFVAPSGEQRRAMWADTMLQVISLRLSDQGAVIFSKVFGPNAISVSISPTSDHVLVGLASRRYLRDTYSNQTYGQVFRLWHSDEPKSLQSFKSQLVLSLEYSALEDTHDDLLFPGSVQMGIVARNLSLNCVVWLPVGQGFVYATNKGRICTVTPSVPRRVTPRRSFAPGASIARRILAAASGSESDDEFDSDD